MKYVIDTNIAFSAVLNTQSKIGDLIMNSNGIFEFCATQSLPAELEKRRPKLLEISKLNEVDLDMAISQIISNFTF